MTESPTFFIPTGGAWPEMVLRRSDGSQVTVTAAQVEAMVETLSGSLDAVWSLVDDTPCNAGNFDGGSTETCEHCAYRRWLETLRAALAPFEVQR